MSLQNASKTERMQHEAAIHMGNAIASHFAKRAGSLAPKKVFLPNSPTNPSDTRSDALRTVSPVKNNLNQFMNSAGGDASKQGDDNLSMNVKPNLQRPKTTNQRRGSNTPSQINSSRFATTLPCDKNLNRIFSATRAH